MKTIQIPTTQTSGMMAVDIEKNLIIIGANGSGKTRFGSKIEQSNPISKRISAQRHLQLNERVPKQDFEMASNQLDGAFKNQSPIQPQNDYQQVLISLFAQESRRNEDAVSAIQSKGQMMKNDLAKSVKEQVIEVWDFVFPYRALKLEKDRIRVSSESQEFSGTEMSDGEKVGLYLISQILLAQKDCLLIIDEPELHLHKALMVRLWNKLEEYRKDCTFVYITHDLDFAVSKPTSKLIWIKSYRDNVWHWDELESNGIVPENLFLEVLGSRKPILFVEGEKGSLDVQIYQSFYENFTVIPRGSCVKVIESVKGLRGNTDLHDKEVFGLIDRDFRPQSQLDALKGNGVFGISLNEVENLFLLPEVIELVCGHLSKTTKKDEVINKIREQYGTNKDHIQFTSSKSAIQRMFDESFGAIKTEEQYEVFKSELIQKMDGLLVSETLPEKDGDILEILKVYPNKGLVKQVQTSLDLIKNGYQNLVLSFLSTDKRQALLDILSKHLPEIK